MSSNDIERARRQEMAVENAVGGLDREEWLDLRRQVAAAASAAEEEEMERAAAAIELARQPRLEPMPRHLLTAIAADADRHFAPARAATTRAAAARPGDATPPTVAGRRSPPAWFAYGGWVAAAASLVAAVVLVLLERPGAVRGNPEAPAVAATTPAEPGPAGTQASRSIATDRSGAVARNATPRDAAQSASAASDGPTAVGRVAAADPAAEREALVAQRFVLRRNWAPAGDPAGRGVEGDVVWDARTQTGYMRFVGLRRNDPSIEQYQLWIFDGRRDQRYPVDGGVFDVRGGDGEVIVPIRARLPVGTPLAFAVTLERSGGVVVSDRGRVVVIARAG
jgi:hypothetical protein